MKIDEEMKYITQLVLFIVIAVHIWDIFTFYKLDISLTNAAQVSTYLFFTRSRSPHLMRQRLRRRSRLRQHLPRLQHPPHRHRQCVLQLLPHRPQQ